MLHVQSKLLGRDAKLRYMTAFTRDNFLIELQISISPQSTRVLYFHARCDQQLHVILMEPSVTPLALLENRVRQWRIPRNMNRDVV